MNSTSQHKIAPSRIPISPKAITTLAAQLKQNFENNSQPLTEQIQAAYEPIICDEVMSPLKKKNIKIRTEVALINMEMRDSVPQKSSRGLENEFMPRSPKKIKSKCSTIHALQQDKAAEAEDQPRCEK